MKYFIFLFLSDQQQRDELVRYNLVNIRKMGFNQLCPHARYLAELTELCHGHFCRDSCG